MKFINLFLIHFLCFIICSCELNRNKYVVDKNVANNYISEKFIINNKLNYEIYYDTSRGLRQIRTFISDTSYEELIFESNGQLYSKLLYNKGGQLNGYGYYFYPSGFLKSLRLYKNNKYCNIGTDYYDYSGIIWHEIFYDTSGEHYMRSQFSDTSSEYEHYFNEKNPNSYKLIKANIPDPQKSKLLRMMEEIGLDSLKQNY